MPCALIFLKAQPAVDVAVNVARDPPRRSENDLLDDLIDDRSRRLVALTILRDCEKENEGESN